MKRPFASIGFTYLIALLAAIFAGVNASVVLGISIMYNKLRKLKKA